MPIYEYKCERCQDVSEKIFSAIDPDFDYSSFSCSKAGCGGEAYRTISAPSGLTGKSGRYSASADIGSTCDSDSKEEFLLLVCIPPVSDNSSGSIN